VIACHEFLEQHCPGGGLMPHKVYDDDDDALDVAAAERICTDCTTSCQIKTVSSNEPNPCLRMPQEVQQWCHHEAEAEAARSPPPPPPVKPVPPTTTPVACNSLHSCEECEAYRTQQGIGYDTIRPDLPLRFFSFLFHPHSSAVQCSAVQRSAPA
jgi:hypothetical protein